MQRSPQSLTLFPYTTLFRSRAEDASGDKQIGHHTSRLGMAESSDGLHFTRRDTPVLYPDRDAQQQNEWPGGVEDPDRKSTRLNSSHSSISYAVFCLKKKKNL